MHEAIGIFGQTPTLSYKVEVRYRRSDRGVAIESTLSEPIILAGGRSKMFGDWNEPGMPEAYARVSQLVDEFTALGFAIPKPTELVNMTTEEP